ncbi:MAG: hypothetical protein Q9176_005636 [Flavoplaca citrina]
MHSPTASWKLIFFFFCLLRFGASQIDRVGWNCNINSWTIGNDCAKAIDGDPLTHWHTRWDSESADSLPHYFKIDLGKEYRLANFTYLPRQDGWSHGNIGKWRISLSTDGTNWQRNFEDSFADDQKLKTVEFGSEPVPARYFYLTAYTEAGSRGPWSSAAEFNLFEESPSGSGERYTAQATISSSNNENPVQSADPSIQINESSVTINPEPTSKSNTGSNSDSEPTLDSNSDKNSTSGGGMDTQTIATIVGTVAGVIAMVATVYMCCWRKRGRS